MQVGSNGWAIAPSHSASGKAMLLAPHLPWSDLFLWYEAQITAPGIDAYGATLVGVPVLAIAFNATLMTSYRCLPTKSYVLVGDRAQIFLPT